MRPLVPSSFPKAGLPLLPGKSASLLGSAGKLGAGAFGPLLHAPAVQGGAHGGAAGHPRSAAPAAEERAPRKRATPEENLDPSARHAAQLAPPGLVPGALPAAPPGTPAEVEARVRSSVEDLLPALVRRVAWSGDGRRGAVRMELGAGEMAGGTLLVQVDDGRVRISLSAPPGVDVAAWRGRILERLEARGLPVDSVEAD